MGADLDFGKFHLSRQHEAWEHGVNGIVPEESLLVTETSVDVGMLICFCLFVCWFDDDDDGKHGELLCVMWLGGEEEADDHLDG